MNSNRLQRVNYFFIDPHIVQSTDSYYCFIYLTDYIKKTSEASTFYNNNYANIITEKKLL